nr:hypothetical protein [Tanacetum cinerariifolium]
PFEDLDDEEEDPEENPKIDLDEEDLEMDVDNKEEEEQLPASPLPLSPLRTPPPVLESSSDYDILVTTTTNVGRPFKGPLATYEIGEPSSVASTSVFSARYELNQLGHDFGILGSRVQSLTWGMGTHRTEIPEAHEEAIKARQRLDKFIWEMSFVIERDIPELMNDSTATGDRLTLLEQDNVKNQEEIQKLRNQVQPSNISFTLAAMDRDQIKKTQDQYGKQIQELRYRLTSAEIRLEVASADRYRLECFDLLALVELFIPIEGNTEKRDATTAEINAIALLRQAIGSSHGRNIGTVLHKLVSMVKKNDLCDELMITVVDTELNVTEFDSEQPMQEDLDIFHASFELHLHALHVD